MSTPAESTTRADGASYAVTITRGEPWPFASRIRGAVTGRCDETLALITPPPASRAIRLPAQDERNGPGRWSHSRHQRHQSRVLGALPGLGATQDRRADEVVPSAVD